MKQIAVLLIIFFGASLSLAQTTWTGYLADKMCSDRLKGDPAKAANHTKECLTEENCAKSGYGVIVEGKWHQFDKEGNVRAAALLNSTTKEKGIKVMVTGTMKKKKIHVTDLTEAS